MRRLMLAGVLSGLVALSGGLACQAAGIEPVQFASARPRLGVLTERRAAEAHTPLPRPQTIDGYLVKPDGVGPFPTVVILHGCSGLSAGFRRDPAASPWVARLLSWGYAVLAFDSFSAREGRPTCGRDVEFYRVADAYGALAFLAQRRDIAAANAIVFGFSSGGIAALSAVEKRDHEPFELSADLRFKAAIAFYPVCVSEGVMAAPALVLIGELDDWSPVARCRFMIAGGEGKGAPITLIVYPGAAHDFGDAALRPTRKLFGHFSAYNRAAADDAVDQVKRFLDQIR
jgi:dienelactone hydrolase